MIKIIKGLEPISLTTYKRSFNATYDDLDKSCKDDIRVHLLREQKNICAYCMGKININNMKIEHYIPRNEETGDSTKQLEYINLLAVCKGGEGTKSDSKKTCDTRKADKRLISVDPLNHNITTLFTYNNKGEILSNSEIVRNDIEDILNLNAYHLQQNRQKALTALKETINKKYKNTNLKGRTLVAIRDSYQRSDNTPYVGILLFYLEKKINQRR